VKQEEEEEEEEEGAVPLMHASSAEQ